MIFTLLFVLGVIVDNGGTYDQSMWLAGKLLQKVFCNYVTKRNKYLKVIMAATQFLFETIYKTLNSKLHKCYIISPFSIRYFMSAYICINKYLTHVS